MSKKILCVDDDVNLLSGIRRTLRGRYELSIAEGGAAALESIRSEGPFAVVITDMRMPGMDGIELIREARTIAPETVYLMLTGNADQQTAVNAVNKGQIFCFLNKPCDTKQLSNALDAALRQYELVTAERQLLQNTLTGSIKLLTDVMGLINPTICGRSTRIKQYVSWLTREMKLAGAWKYELAGMLSQLGCVGMPPDIVEKAGSAKKLTSSESEMFGTHPDIAMRLLSRIPRMEIIGRMIGNHLKPFTDLKENLSQAGTDEVIQGATILRVAVDFDRIVCLGLTQSEAVKQMHRYPDEYDPVLLEMLVRMPIDVSEPHQRRELQELPALKLKEGMIAAEDIYTKQDIMILQKGKEITEMAAIRILNFANGVGVKEPVKVMVLVYGEGSENRAA